ncbi:MAG: hypothetical protein AAGU19_08045 [Prolixibacteraceae bacterium]
MKTKTYFTELQYAQATFLEGCNMRRTEKLLNNMPENPQWCQLSNEYGDVWHKVIKLSENETMPIYSYCNYFGRGGKKEMSYFHSFRCFTDELPASARIIYDEATN